QPVERDTDTISGRSFDDMAQVIPADDADRAVCRHLVTTTGMALGRRYDQRTAESFGSGPQRGQPRRLNAVVVGEEQMHGWPAERLARESTIEDRRSKRERRGSGTRPDSIPKSLIYPIFPCKEESNSFWRAVKAIGRPMRTFGKRRVSCSSSWR